MRSARRRTTAAVQAAVGARRPGSTPTATAGWNLSADEDTVSFAMVRTVLLGVALLAAVAAPAPAGGHAGFHGGRGFHGHHGFRHHGSHVFFSSAIF